MTHEQLERLRRLAAWFPAFSDPDFSAGTWEGGKADENGVTHSGRHVLGLTAHDDSRLP